MFFDKTRIVRHFNIRREYESYKLSAKQQSIELYNKCVHYFDSTYYDYIRCDEFKNNYYYLINEYLKPYKQQLLSNLTFREMYDNFTIKSSELIKCSAKLHFRHKTNNNDNNSSDSQVMTDCSQSYAVLETIYGNKDFGICFTYFYTNTDNQYLIDDDFVQFDINYETQQNFLINGYFEANYSTLFKKSKYTGDEWFPLKKPYFDDYFALNFVVTSPMTTLLMAQKETTIRSTRIGLNARLKIMTTHFHRISSPYMSECNEQGMRCLIYPNSRPLI